MENIEKLSKEYSQLQQQIQTFYIQKENSRVELNEINTALDELKTVEGDVFKQAGIIIIKSAPKKVSKELEEKKEIIELRIRSIEKKESALKEKFQKLHQELLSAQEKTE